jgi:nucleotide-binding universal stress UspA family protein
MTNNKEKLVFVPTDFTEAANFATEHAIGIAKLLKYKVCLFHVINKETKAKLKKEGKTEESIKEKMDLVASGLKNKHKVEIMTTAKDGSIFSSIAEVADNMGAEFLTMGTHGKVGVQKFIGSYAWKVVTGSPVPVIVIQKGAKFKGYLSIVMNVDHTMESKQKITWAVYIAKIFSSLVHLTFQPETDEFLANKTKANLAQMKRVLEKNKIKYTEKTLNKSGNLATLLEEYANNINAELIMVMTDKEKSTFILSPWAEQILFNKSKIPVMCINPIDSHVSQFTPY